MKIVQVSRSDLVGRKFNGHDLHLYQRRLGHDSRSLVLEKRSDDPATHVCRGRDSQSFTHYLFRNSLLLDADVIHLHLLQGTLFDIDCLPMLSSLRPLVWTLHDPWLFGGHCVHPAECRKWREHCRDCPRLAAPFRLAHDTSALEFARKRRAVRDSQAHFIVASRWMAERAAAAPIMAGKKIHLVPFGIDTEFFQPGDTAEARRRLDIPPGAPVLLLRQQAWFKGVEVVKRALADWRPDRPVVILTVGHGRGMLDGLAADFQVREFGWVADDEQLRLLYQASDLLLMPSEQEAFGLMAVEAMSCGKPVLALTGTALPEIIDSPRCGLAVDRQDFSTALRDWLARPEELAERGRRCRAHARRRYHWLEHVEAVRRVYEEAIADFHPDDEARLVLEQLRRWGRDEARTEAPPPDAVRRRLEQLGWRDGMELCIFGCGLYGRRLWRELKGRDIRVACFADNDARKWGGRMADGTPCLSPAELDRDHTLVVAATAEPEELVASLVEQGFSRAISYEDIWSAIVDACPGDFTKIHVD